MALAEQLVDAMGIKKAMEESMEMAMQMVPAQMEQIEGEDSDSAEEAREHMDEVMEFVKQEMSWDRIKDEYISIYARTFTEEELEGILEFYKSPIGIKFAEKQPELMKQAMEINQRRMMELMPKMKKFAEQLDEADDAGEPGEDDDD